MSTPDLSICVVNFNSSHYLGDLLGSLLGDPFTIDGRPGEVEVIVVDNASPNDDHLAIQDVAGNPRVRLVRNTENVGYGIANEQALRIARGRWHLVINPDVVVMPGCLQTLIDTLEAIDEAEVVGPLASFDPGGHVLLPPIELPDPYTETLTNVSRHDDAVARFTIRHRARAAHRFWAATTPTPMPMLSGQCFLARRETFLEHGLFDPAYPLYYEDTDLFRRYTHEGLGLYHVPAARIVHHFSRSTMSRLKASMYRNRIGALRYFGKWFGETGRRTFESVHARADARGLDDSCPFDLIDVTSGDAPPTIEIPEHDGVYLETAGNPKFSLAAAMFPGSTGAFTFPDIFWGALGEMSFWCRAVNPETGDTLRAWRISKCPAT